MSQGPSSLTRGRTERPTVLSMPEEEEPFGVLPPDGDGVWHMVPWALALVAICGREIEYGARLKAWAETPPEDRCDVCLRRSPPDSA